MSLTAPSLSAATGRAFRLYKIQVKVQHHVRRASFSRVQQRRTRVTDSAIKKNTLEPFFECVLCERHHVDQIEDYSSWLD